MKWFHGTSQDTWDSIKEHGVDFEARRKSDPGDMGWGFYLTGNLARAKSYGSTVLEAEVEESALAVIPNPYFLDGLERTQPQTAAEKLFFSLAFDGEKMLTVNGTTKEREDTAKEIRRTFLRYGYKGIRSSYAGGETVIFDSSAIIKIDRKE